RRCLGAFAARRPTARGARRARATGAVVHQPREVTEMIRVGLAFFPDVDESERPAARYFKQCLDFVELGDRLGFHHVRIVEHYFRKYGGYSPNPIVFLAAAAERSRQLRLITGAVLPVFNHPLKLAGEIGMLDAISQGRA